MVRVHQDPPIEVPRKWFRALVSGSGFGLSLGGGACWGRGAEMGWRQESALDGSAVVAVVAEVAAVAEVAEAFNGVGNVQC